MTTLIKTKPQVTMPQLLAFIAPCLPFAALGLPLSVTLSEYYANHIGLSLQVVGTVFLLVRMCDILVDPLIGWQMDKTRTKWGRFKLWMAICVPILMLSTWYIFMAPVGASAQYLGLWLFIIYVGFSIAALSQAGWGSVLSSDYDERTKIFAWWQVANIFGVLIAVVTPLIAQLYHKTYAQGVQYMGWMILILLPSMVGLALWIVPEKLSNTNSHSVKLRDYFSMFKRKNVRCILWADLFLGLAPGITAALFFFYFEQAKGLVRLQTSICLLLYFLAGVIGAPIWILASKRFSKHKTLLISSLIFAVLYGLLALVPAHNFIISAVAVFLTGIPYAASLFLTRALMADIGDEVIYETQHDHKGSLMAILSATTKLGYAFSVFTMAILGWLGFDNKLVQNSPEALIWVQVFFIGLPIIFLLLGAFSLRDYDLSREKHALIQDEINLRQTQ